MRIRLKGVVSQDAFICSKYVMHDGRRIHVVCNFSFFLLSKRKGACVDPLKYFQFCELKVYESNSFLSLVSMTIDTGCGDGNWQLRCVF